MFKRIKDKFTLVEFFIFSWIALGTFLMIELSAHPITDFISKLVYPLVFRKNIWGS